MKKGLIALMVCALLVVLFGQTAWAAPPTGTSTCTRSVHIVRWGENLWRISRWYGTTVDAIAHANHIANPHRIYAGQRLVIPCGYGHDGGHPRPYPPDGGHPRPYPPDGGHPRPYPPPGPGPCKPGYGTDCGSHWPQRHGFHYVVRYGDTLSGIAWRFGVNMWSIVRANGIANPNCIYAGQWLYIP